MSDHQEMPTTWLREYPHLAIEPQEYISRVMIELAQKADVVNRSDLARGLMLAGAALNLGRLDEITRLVRTPGMPEEIAKLPIKSMTELENDYREHVRKSHEVSLNLSGWLPSLDIRSLVPGEMAVVLADTGVGKTAILQNVARVARNMAVLMFQLELPGTLLFERYAAMSSGYSGNAIYHQYRDNDTVDYGHADLAHIWTCDRSGLAPEDIEGLIMKSADKIKKAPGLVIVDYIGLLRGRGKRYERISDAAEQLKITAKNTNTIILLASQLSRPDDKEIVMEPKLHHAKDSGSIENSCGLVLGAWRDATDKGKLWLKVLKNTKGFSGKKIACRFNTNTMRIDELQEVNQ